MQDSLIRHHIAFIVQCELENDAIFLNKTVQIHLAVSPWPVAGNQRKKIHIISIKKLKRCYKTCIAEDGGDRRKKPYMSLQGGVIQNMYKYI